MNNFKIFLEKLNIDLEKVTSEENKNTIQQELKDKILWESNYIIDNFHFYMFTFKILNTSYIKKLANDLLLPKRYTYDTTMMIEFIENDTTYTLTNLFYTKKENENLAKQDYEKLDNIVKDSCHLDTIFKNLIQML